MGKIKEVLAELDNGHDAVISLYGLAIGDIHLTINDLEQTLQMIRYLREVRPFETLKEIAASSFPELAELTERIPVVSGAVAEKKTK